jgi:integrase
MSLYRRPNSPFLWSKLYVGGEVVRFSTGERTKVKALRKESERAKQLERAAKIEGRFTLATLAAKFVDWKSASGRAEATIAAIELHIEVHILPFFGAETDVRMIDLAAMEEYKAARMKAVSHETVSKELSTLRQMLRYAVEVHGIIDSVPPVRDPSGRYEPKWKFLTRDQLGALLTELAHRRSRDVLPFFLLLANTGMRTGETTKMTWEMVDFAARKLRLPAAIRKTKKPLVLDLNDGAEAALRMLPVRDAKDRVFRQKDYRGALEISCTNIGIDRIRPHDFRHTFASLLHSEGVPLPIVRDQLGHSTMMMVNLYAHSFDEARQKAVESVSIQGLHTGKRER